MQLTNTASSAEHNRGLKHNGIVVENKLSNPTKQPGCLCQTFFGSQLW